MLDKLKENPKNPRTLNKAAFEKLKNKIRSFRYWALGNSVNVNVSTYLFQNYLKGLWW